MAGFASSVMLGDLNDFISPSQACVNPIFSDSANASAQDQGNAPDTKTRPKISLAFESDLAVGGIQTQAPNLIKTSASKTAKVSLSDCLACSGCVTSAETVLIQQQSIEEFKSAVSANNAADSPKLVVVSIATQSLSGLAKHFEISRADAWTMLSNKLKSLGVDKVISAQVGGDVALVENKAEFLYRYQQANESSQKKWEAPQASVAVSKTEVHFPTKGSEGDYTAEKPEIPNMYSQVPMIASSCPGWICFAEKTHPETIPYISTVKSPQQIMGSTVKSISPGTNIYHVTVMPCPDKKLEGARKDFFDDLKDANDVDCVLTTSELVDLLNESTGESHEDVDMAPAGTVPTDTTRNLAAKKALDVFEEQDSGIAGAFRSGSGGYLEYIFRKSAKELFGVDLAASTPLPYKQVRNKDFQTVELQVDGKTVLNFAAVYGFRNIQTIIRQLKRGTCPYHYVEIMACPGGCLNGGGQPALQVGDTKGAVATARAKAEKLAQLEVSHHEQRIVRDPSVLSTVAHVYQRVGGGCALSDDARKQFHTRYHAVPKLENSLLEKW